MIRFLQRPTALLLAILMMVMALPVGSMELREALDHHNPLLVQQIDHDQQAPLDAATNPPDEGKVEAAHADGACDDGHCCSDICTATPLPTLLTSVISATPAPLSTPAVRWENLPVPLFRPPKHA